MTETPKTITDKSEIIKLAKEYLRENSLIDLTGFVQDHCPPTHSHSAFVRDIAYKMRTTGEFEITEKENGGRFYVYRIPKKDWRERNPLAHDIILAIITALLSLGVGWLLLKSSNQEQETRDKKQESDILILTDSVNSLKGKVHVLGDSLKTISEENKKLKTKSE